MTQDKASTAQDQTSWSSWWMVAVLFLVYVFSWLDRLIISMMVAPIKTSLMLSDFEMSIILGPAFALSYALFGVPLGWAADRFPRRIVIAAGVLIWTLATIACGFANSFAELAFFRVLVGIGEAALLPAAYSLIADGFPPARLTLATSIFQTAGKVGSATAFGLGGLAIALAQNLSHIHWPIHGDAYPWQIVMIMVGLPGFLFLLLMFSFREPERRKAQGQSLAQPQEGKAALKAFVTANPLLLTILVVAFACLAIVGFSLTSWVPAYIDRRFHWAPQSYGPALSLMNIFAATTLVLNGWIVDRLFKRGMVDVHLRYFSWLILLLSPVIVSMFFIHNAYIFLACYALIQIITVPYIVFVSALVALLAPPAIRGQLLGVFMLISNLAGSAGGPALVGALTDFFFKDESKLGESLAIVVISCATLSWLLMRWGLRYLAPAIRARQQGQA